MKALLPDLQVFASAQVADVVERGDDEAMSLAAGKRAEFYPRDFRFRPCSVDGRLAEGDQLSIGDLDITVVETRGHSAGHLCFLPGHHCISLARGQRHIDAAKRLFDRGFVPRSVV